MKKQRKIEKDNRGVAIYARKSRITNKGDSIGVQFKQCADYAKKELGLDEEYEFLQYEDKGLSGYFSDRPDFQRMLHDVQDGKIKAIVCYKLDRVGRKTADLIRLMDFLEMYHVNLLICSNGINTASGLYKIFIQIFAVIAEFERDTLTERIVDNMMELAKDGRWLGGNTPMGFTVRRVTTGSGKGKSAYSYLESLPEEKRMVQRLYEIFRTTRSIQSTAKQMNEEGFHTPSGAAFNASTTRLVLRNPIYCTADKRSYNYFIEHDGNVFGDMTEFDGTHGLSAYNKTDQEKYEGSDSTFISPKYVQTIESKPVSEWIIAVGRHEGFISSEQWIEVQELLDAIAEKYNRPHRKTNALLAGLVHCPHCGRRLSVISESDRWTNGKPRFKYVCPGYRKKECNFKAVDGVLLDEFVVQQLSDLSDENSERFKDILEIKIEEVLEKSQTVQEHTFIKKKRDKLKADIAAQTRNLREADGNIKQFIQEDLQNLAEELRETERQLSKLDEGRKNNMIAIRDLEMTKERLLSFAEYAKDAQPEVLVTLIQTIVERIYIVDKDDERFCHIFIKGCSGEDYTGFFQTAGYIEQKTTPVCDSEQYCIDYMLEGHVNIQKQLILRDKCPQNILKYWDKFILASEQSETNPSSDILYIQAKEARREFEKSIENTVRKEFGFKNVGESWVSETTLANIIKTIYSNYEVKTHYRPKWLEGLELDIYIDAIKLGIEYQGQQHYNPIKHWGGEKQLKKQKEHDSRKARICREKGVTLLTVDFDEPLTEIHIRERLKEKSLI